MPIVSEKQSERAHSMLNVLQMAFPVLEWRQGVQRRIKPSKIEEWVLRFFQILFVIVAQE